MASPVGTDGGVVSGVVAVKLKSSTATSLLQLEPVVPTILNFTVHDTHGEYIDDPREVDRMWGKQLGAVIDSEILVENPPTVIDLTQREPEIIRVGQGDPDIFY